MTFIANTAQHVELHLKARAFIKEFLDVKPQFMNSHGRHGHLIQVSSVDSRGTGDLSLVSSEIH
jgi:hypothetical protein